MPHLNSTKLKERAVLLVASLLVFAALVGPHILIQDDALSEALFTVTSFGIGAIFVLQEIVKQDRADGLTLAQMVGASVALALAIFFLTYYGLARIGPLHLGEQAGLYSISLGGSLLALGVLCKKISARGWKRRRPVCVTEKP